MKNSMHTTNGAHLIPAPEKAHVFGQVDGLGGGLRVDAHQRLVDQLGRHAAPHRPEVQHLRRQDGYTQVGKRA